MVILYVTLYVLGWLITAACIVSDPYDYDKMFGVLIVSAVFWHIILVLLLLMQVVSFLVHVKQKYLGWK